MRTSVLVSIVLAVHCMAVGFLLMMQGCGTPRIAAKEGTAPMPPAEVKQDKDVFPPPVPGAVKQAPSKPTTYVIAKGDTLSHIAKRFHLSVAELKALNKISNPNSLRVGQTILLPGEGEAPAAVSPVVAPAIRESAPKAKVAQPKAEAAIGSVSDGAVYSVKQGDMLARIARNHGTTVEAIKSANNLKSDMIRVGQKLKMPGTGAVAKKPAADRVGSSVAARQEKPVAPVEAVSQPVVKQAPKAVTENSSLLSPAPEAIEPAVSVETPASVPAVEADGPVKAVTVGDDDDLYSIAMTWGVSVAEIKKLNGLADDTVKPGQTLKIPVSDSKE